MKNIIFLYILPIVLVLDYSAANNINNNNTHILPYVSETDITVIVNETSTFELYLSGFIDQNVNVTLRQQHTDLIEIYTMDIAIKAINQNILLNYTITVKGINPGLLDVLINTNPSNVSKIKPFVRVTVALSNVIIYVSIVVGWIYFIAWSASFYPQIYDNFRRKSVVGLNFDFLSFNIVGSALYSAFNIGLLWSPIIQNEYFQRYPRGVNPVLINDALFSLHALLATLFTVGQCIFMEKGQQRVSNIARVILGTFFVLVCCFTGLAIFNQIHWLDFLYYCSYIKLTITLIKYIPQAVMNYRRKSTVGWSIGCIFLDIIGGVFSILQMLLNAYNHDDWASIFGDPTKFGLGLFSICFDIFFVIQHYAFYRVPRTGLRENDSNLDKLLNNERA